MSGVPGMGSEDRSMVELLEIIAVNTGGLDASRDGEIDITHQPGVHGQRPIDPGGYSIYETADLDKANPDGTVTVQPGEEAVLAETPRMDRGWALYAAGAVDEDDCAYYIRIDNELVVGGTTASPLGTINSPFSFPETMGGYVPASTVVELLVRYSAEASGEINLAGRIHVEAL